jgi:anti-sigma regulatory factor (Ser/Thr protein kinase)
MSDEIASKSIMLTIPADLAYVHILSRCACALLEQIDELADAEVTLYNLELAIQEIGVNIITHAYADYTGTVVMRCVCDEQARQLSITLDDCGKSFDPAQVAMPAIETLQEHGFGLFLARELLDELTYESSARGNRWRLKKSY